MGPAENFRFANCTRVQRMRRASSKAAFINAGCSCGRKRKLFAHVSFEGPACGFFFRRREKEYCHLWSRAARVFSCGQAAVQLCGEGGDAVTVPLLATFLKTCMGNILGRIFLEEYSWKNILGNNILGKTFLGKYSWKNCSCQNA